MTKLFYALLVSLFFLPASLLQAQQKTQYSDNGAMAGFSIKKQDASGIELIYSLPEYTISRSTIDGKSLHSIEIPGIILPNNAGAPNVPGIARYLGIPEGSAASFEILDMQVETVQNIDLAPAPRIPKENEDGLEYPVNKEIYNNNAFYPSQPVLLSEPTEVRGMDVVMLGVSPFQYNPVTKELKVYKSLRLKVNYTGGNGTFGDTRLRSRWFDPLLQDLLLNPTVLPEINYNKSTINSDEVGFEYLIIVPDAPYFSAWADSIKLFRQKQGIITGIKTLSEIGGNNWSTIENYLNDAYNTWTIPPVACLLIGDYGTNINNTIDSPIWDSYCVSDNIYGDVNGDDMPDIVMARMTAQNEAQLEVMVRKFMDYERNPPVSENFYHHPITALGWQTERWFQVCSEVIGGFWKNVLDKDPVRINAVYDGDPTVDFWSTAQNTTDVINYFGPSGLNYIPATPQGIGGFSGGTPAMVTAALNEGSFMLQHRDHGFEDGWGEPAFTSAEISNLTNTDLTYIMSVNCLTGKYNNSTEVFAEKFHRYTFNNQPAGALGILAASEVSYSFVNDAYIWGVYDNLWPEFMPAYGSTPAERGILPAFGNAAGKYFLQQSNWPYNTTEKEVTYNLFHHHGDAFLTVYSEIPQSLTVVHDPTILTGVTSFNVTANAGSLICLSLHGEILGTATGTGSPVSITIPGTQLPPDQIDVVVTLQNYYRYEGIVTVIPPAGPYVVKDNFQLNDSNGNNNGLLDYGENVQLSLGVKNVGISLANAVSVTLSTTDPYVTISNNTANYGDIPAGSVIMVNNAFAFSVADSIPDNHNISFSITATDGTNTWPSYFTIKGHAPKLSYVSYTVSDPAGNNDGKIDPGETVTLSITAKNSGSASAFNINGLLTSNDPYLTIVTATQNFGDIVNGGNSSATFTIAADPATPAGHMAGLNIELTANQGITGSGVFSVIIGQIPILIIDLDPNHSSGPIMSSTILGLGLSVDYQTSIPADLNLYSSIFVCLGIYSSNHQLNTSEGQALKNYLDNGGRLYMEGADTWNYDQQTAVHPYFKISSPQDGSGDLSTLMGQTGTFTEGMNFPYNGENSYIDRLNPASGSTAFKIFQNASPSYGSGIAYDGGSYKTIGCSHEFGGLTDGSFPSTKNELMHQYLIFFGIIPEGLNADFTVSGTSVCVGGLANFTDISSGNPVNWYWSFPGGNPASSTLQNPVVAYDNTGNYDVTLIVSDGTTFDTLVKHDYIQVITAPSQTSFPSGPAVLCNNTPFTVISTASIPGATSYVWSLTPATAGVISGNTSTATIYWNVTYTGIAEVTVKGVNNCGTGPESSPFQMTLNPAPTVTLSDFGNVCKYWPSFLLSGGSPAGGTYSGTGVVNGYFNPSMAQIGYNQITYTYVDNNACSASATKSIFVDGCTGIYYTAVASPDVEISPNPVHDKLTVILNDMKTGTAMVKISNKLGEILAEYPISITGDKHEFHLNTTEWAEGLYFITIKKDQQSFSKKFIVE